METPDEPTRAERRALRAIELLLQEPAGHTHNPLVRYFRTLGPGLVTGASDDDPSGITTYSIAGASFGYGMLWCVLVTMPLMIARSLSSSTAGSYGSPSWKSRNFRTTSSLVLTWRVLAAL